MRKLLYVLAVVIVTPVAFLSCVFCLWCFTTTNNVSVNIYNRSQSTLQNLTVSVPGRSDRFGDVPPTNGAGGFPAYPHFTYPVEVSFDAEGQHYDLRATTHVLPVCSSIVALYIDEQMRLSVRSAPEFAW